MRQDCFFFSELGALLEDPCGAGTAIFGGEECFSSCDRVAFAHDGGVFLEEIFQAGAIESGSDVLFEVDDEDAPTRGFLLAREAFEHSDSGRVDEVDGTGIDDEDFRIAIGDDAFGALDDGVDIGEVEGAVWADDRHVWAGAGGWVGVYFGEGVAHLIAAEDCEFRSHGLAEKEHEREDDTDEDGVVWFHEEGEGEGGVGDGAIGPGRLPEMGELAEIDQSDDSDDDNRGEHGLRQGIERGCDEEERKEDEEADEGSRKPRFRSGKVVDSAP